MGKPGEGKLWKVGCHSGPVSRCNGSISTTGSKANVMGDERLQLRAAIACAPTLSYLCKYMYVLMLHLHQGSRILFVCMDVLIL